MKTKSNASNGVRKKAVNYYYLSRFELTEDLCTVDAGIGSPNPWVWGLRVSNLLPGSEEWPPNGTGPNDPNSSSPSSGNTSGLEGEPAFEEWRGELDISDRAVFPRPVPLKMGSCNCGGGSWLPPSSMSASRQLLRWLEKWLACTEYFPFPGEWRSLYAWKFYKNPGIKTFWDASCKENQWD